MEIQYLVTFFLTFLIDFTWACPPQCHSCDGGIANCLGAGIRNIPRQFPEDIITIDLTNNQITELNSRTFQKLPNVRTVRMAGNGINILGARVFQTLPSMTNLDLSGNPLSSIHNKAFEGLDNLVTLSLSNNDLRRIGRPFKEMPSLSSLILGYNKLQQIEEDDFEENARIRMLDLSNNKISTIHGNAFKNLKMLRYLMLNNNPIGIVNDLTFTSSMLQLVDFTNCQLRQVPRTMPSSVADFRLGNNRIREIREYDFQNISNLRLVTLNNNEINKVAYKAFKPLDHLMEIWLSHNNMIYIPRGLPSNLTKIYMDHNQIFEIESQHFGPEPKLEVLSLEMSNVNSIPHDAFIGMKHLKHVNLQGNKLNRLKSSTFANLPALETIQLSNNPIEIIEPEAFKNLPNLTTLAMSYIRSVETSVSQDFLSVIARVNNLQFVFSPGLVKSLLAYYTRPGAPALPGIRSITLQYNDLQTMSEYVKIALENVQKILLDGNPWHCDKRLIWLKDWLRNSDILFYENEPLACETPANLYRSELQNLHNDDFAEVSVDVETVQVPSRDRQSNNDRNVQQNSRSEQNVQQNSRSEQNVQQNSRSEQNSQSDKQLQPSRVDSRLMGTNVRVVYPASTTTTPRPTRRPRKKKQRGKKRKKGKKRKNKKRRRKNGKKRRKKDGRNKRRIGKGRKRRRCRTKKDGTVVCRKRRKKLKQNTTPTESSTITL